jgi:hypothetical protein
MNKYAQKIGRLARGVAKNFTLEYTEVLKQRLAKARKKRWPKK